MPAISPPPGASRLFGTDGIRGVVGELYTPSFLADIASAYGSWLGGSGTVTIARDFRTTSPGFAGILGGTLQMLGLDVLDLGIMPTPCSQFNVRALQARGGLMITASHNPPEYNGIKFTGPDGLEIGPADEAVIERIFRERSFRPPAWRNAGRLRPETGGIDRYAESIERNVDRRAIAERSSKVVVDPGNGSSARVVPRVARELGCRVTTLNANGDGLFPGRNSEPTEAHLLDLERTVPAIGADFGIAFDGDADRLGVVDEAGHYVSGDVVFALFARYVLRRHPKGVVVTSVTSSSLVGDVVAAEGGTLIVTRSGSLPVALGVRDHRAVLGGEENGHFYWPEHQNAPDAPMSAAVLIEMIARERRPLSELAAELPVYCLVKRNVPVAPRERPEVLTRIRAALSAQTDHLETLDGVKAYFSDGWILIRPSGTEPLIRIFAESRSSERVRSLAAMGERVIAEAVASTRAASAAG